MAFLSPLFLLGALAASVPILLHLLKRDAAQAFDTTLTGDASLSKRPMNRVAKPLREEDLSAELRRWAPRGEADRRAA